MSDIDLDAQAERDAADIRASWAGYQWKVRELIDRAQAAEADWARSQVEVRRLQAENIEEAKGRKYWWRRATDAEDRVAVLEAGIRDAADEITNETGVDDHYLAAQLRALLDGDSKETP